MGLRDYCSKNGIERVYLGLSGGIDSTLVATLACDALGADHVYGISNPSAYSSEHSKSDAAELAARTGLHFRRCPSPQPSTRFTRCSISTASPPKTCRPGSAP